MSQPNIVVLVTDQERYRPTVPDNDTVETPALDKLAQDGVRFEHAFTPISLCTPARASMLTGQYPHTHGMLNNCHEADSIQPDLPPRTPTYSELLHENGYTNFYSGKWHVGKRRSPEDYGFTTVASEDNHHDPSNLDFKQFQREHDVDPSKATLKDPIYTDRGILVSATTTLPERGTVTNYLTERAINTIEAQTDSDVSQPRYRPRNPDAPYHLRLDFPGPHHPYVVPEKYASLYDPDDIEPWENFDDNYENKPNIHDEFQSYRGVDEFDWDTWCEAVARYYGFITYLDKQIGRILDALDRTGQADNTIVIHASDHGDFTGSHGHFNKGPMMYDETYRVPLIASGPEIESGLTISDPVTLVDLMPTLLDVADIDIPDGVQGESLMPLLRGETETDWRNSVFAEYHGEEFGLYSQRMVRTDRYKFVYNGPDINEFYDLKHDPHELTNQIDNDEYTDEIMMLKQRLADWMEQTNDPIRKWAPRSFLDSTVSNPG